MYSIMPALVSMLFLGYGVYVLASHGPSRISLTFFLICTATFAWQFAWSLLFLVHDEALAHTVARLGYLLILFLPTTIYHFVAELTRRRAERRAVIASYCSAALLGVVLLASDAIVAGVHGYFFGFYPKAGALHPLHVLQTVVVVVRALWLLLQQHRVAVSTERLRLAYCLASLMVYFAAAADYLCNYGVEFYPPGVVFVAISLGIIAQAMARHNPLANPLLLAATIAHEVRTPLATIRSQARVLARDLPELIAGYDYAVKHGGLASTMRDDHLEYLRELAQHIEAEVSRSNFIADMVLASASFDTLDTRGFSAHSVKKCVDEALASYPFDSAMRERVVLGIQQDFEFHGSDKLLVYVLYNLIKNALCAIKAAGRGRIEIAFYSDAQGKHLCVTDTGPGIAPHVLPHVFDPFYTTGRGAGGTGMGLAFCRRVVSAFGGSIRCSSREGQFTSLKLKFPHRRGLSA